MMPILRKGLPVDLSQTEEIFYNHLGSWNWQEAEKMIGKDMEHLLLKSSKKFHNIFDYASNYVVSCNRSDEQIEPLFALVEKAVKIRLEVRMNCAFYMNPLHILARGKEDGVTLKLLKCILCNIDSIYINAYNKFGKTPLLEAIASKNEKTALELLEHSETDVNLCKIHNISTRAHAAKAQIVECINIAHGSSAYTAACSLHMSTVAERILKHPKYIHDVAYVYPNSGDVIRYQHFLFAEQGNVDTLKVLFKTYDAETLMCVDDLYWTMLHVACFASNLPVVQFLLDKSELDKVVGFEIETNLYSEFVNRIDDAFYTALGRVLFAHMKGGKQQIHLFINCPHFSVNDVQDCTGNALIHYIAQMNDTNLMEDLAKREGLIFDKENIKGQTALEVAAMEGNLQMVETLCKFGSQGKDINPNRYSRKCELVNRLSTFMEEGWFGPISIDELTIDDLIEVYRTREPKEIKVTYRKFFVDFSVTQTSGQTITDHEMKSIKEHLAYYCDSVHNEGAMILFDLPSWIDTELYSQIKHSLQTQSGVTFPLRMEITLEINGCQYKIIGHPKRIQQVARVATIHYEHLCQYLGEHEREMRVRMLSGDYVSLLATLVDQAQKEKDQTRKESFLNVIRVLVQFCKTKLNIVIKMHDEILYLDSIITDDAVKNIFDTERKQRQANPQKTPCKHCLKYMEKVCNPSLYKFVEQFIYKIESKNIERQCNNIDTDEQCRRIDSLARLFEGDGVCAAILFHGSKMYYATNATSTGTCTLSQLKIISDTLCYFVERSNPSSKHDLRTDKLELLKCMVQAKCLHRITNKAKKSVLNGIVDKIQNNIEKFEDYVLQEGLRLDKYNTLSMYSCQKAFELCDFDITAVSGIFNDASYQNNANAIFRCYARYILDFKKIEDHIQTNPDSDFVLALKNSTLIGENVTCHAEMKVVQFCLDTFLDIDGCYIGISKLCCAHCNLILDSIGTNSHKIKTRGAHGEDSKWVLPEFMKTVQGFDRIFYSDATFCARFRVSFNANKEDTLYFIENYSMLKDHQELHFLYETLARKTRPQEHDWSDYEE